MLTYFKDVWEGFSTVLVGMNITWRHLFVNKVTLHYPEEKWQLPPKSRMRLFMAYEDCIGCGQCARACPAGEAEADFDDARRAVRAAVYERRGERGRIL